MVPHLPRRLSKGLNERLRSPDTAATVADLEGKLTRRRMAQKFESGEFRGLRLVLYRGFAADGVAKVRLRLTEAPEIPGSSRIPYWETVQSNLRRHGALAIVGAEVTVRIDGSEDIVETDMNGYAIASLDVPDLDYGWHDVFAVTTPVEGQETATGTGRVINPDLDASFAVISDIDDTILRSGLTEGLNAVRHTLLNDANSRTAIAGMASLYRGLARGGAHDRGHRPPEPPFFYVSTGSWSFYDTLSQFIQARAFPAGPMFLTEWGPTERYVRRSGAEHKRHSIRRILLAYPGMQFVLIGDSGQRDPILYEEVARDFPEQVRLILIRQVGDDDDERNSTLSERATALRGEGIPFYLVPDAAQAAKLSEAMGLCDGETVLEVQTELGHN